jgi:hypothetical protein
MNSSGSYLMKVLHTQWVMNMRPALEGRMGVSTSVALRQYLQQRLGVLQIRRIKPFGDLLPMAKARGIPPLGRTPNALPAPQAPAYLPMAKARGITQDLVTDENCYDL